MSNDRLPWFRSKEVQSAASMWAANPICRNLALLLCCIACTITDRWGNTDSQRTCEVLSGSPLVWALCSATSVAILLFCATSFMSILLTVEVLAVFAAVAFAAWPVWACLDNFGACRMLTSTQQPQIKGKKTVGDDQAAAVMAAVLRAIQRALTILGVTAEVLIGSVLRVLFDVLLIYADFSVVLPAFGFKVPTIRVSLIMPELFSFLVLPPVL